MKKMLLNPKEGQVDSDTGPQWADHDTAYSRGVVVQGDGYKRLFLTGICSEKDGVEAQTRDILQQIEAELENLDGGMEDIVRVRVFVSKPNMDEQTLETIHDIRNEFFVQEHLPASTLIEIEDLVRDRYLVEIDADAVIPDDGWDIE
ncbi:RidA family protein [Haloplanus halobius]|uniref:RidA family protein n=1 Tax=Haloplanus halobius TaxID=2934938 RepID=UPI00200E1F31|nr:RidA family protein [Haloplanus sp. XH21]